MGSRKNVILTKSTITIKFCKINVIKTLWTIKNSQVTNQLIINLKEQPNPKSSKCSWKRTIHLEIKFTSSVGFDKAIKLKTFKRIKAKK